MSRASLASRQTAYKGRPVADVRNKLRLLAREKASLHSASKSFNFKLAQNTFGAWILACWDVSRLAHKIRNFSRKLMRISTLNSRIRALPAGKG